MKRLVISKFSLLLLVFFISIAQIACQSSQIKTNGENQYPQTNDHITYINKKLNIRSAPSSDSSIVGVLYPGDRVRLGIPEKNWIAVFNVNEPASNNEYAIGYVHVPVIPENLKGLPLPYQDNIRYVEQNTHIRAKRTKYSSIAGILYPGDKVKVGFYKIKWFAVFNVNESNSDEEKAIGYVFAPLLKKLEGDIGESE